MFSEMSYCVRRFMAFTPNDKCYGDIHYIVCSNDLILYTTMHLGMVNNVAEEIFHFVYTKKIFFIFRVSKMRFFVKHLPNLCSKFEPQQFLKILDPSYVQITKYLCVKGFSSTFEKRQISADSVGTR